MQPFAKRLWGFMGCFKPHEPPRNFEAEKLSSTSSHFSFFGLKNSKNNEPQNGSPASGSHVATPVRPPPGKLTSTYIDYYYYFLFIYDIDYIGYIYYIDIILIVFFEEDTWLNERSPCCICCILQTATPGGGGMVGLVGLRTPQSGRP